MLSLFGGWASTTTINLLRSGWHFPLHYGICWEFSHPRCPFQRIFPTSLHPPSKLLYRCLATTDLLVGLVPQPLNALYWVSVFQENWSLCRYAFDATKTTGYVLLLVTLMTMTAISVDRLLALMLGLRYKQIVTLRYHQAQERDKQPASQTNTLNMARFRKAVDSALWVQLALVVMHQYGQWILWSLLLKNIHYSQWSHGK